MRTDDNDHLHRLNVHALQAMNKNIFTSFTSEKVAALGHDVDEYDSWERKVLNNFLEADRIKVIPAGYKKRLVVLKWLVNHFEDGVKYLEKQINEIIKCHYPDYCTLRREFIINGLMEREDGVYWRTE